MKWHSPTPSRFPKVESFRSSQKTDFCRRFQFEVGTPSPLEALPPGAAARLKSLRQHAADVHALMPDFETRQAALAAKLEAEARLKQLTDHAQSGGFGLGDGTPQVLAATKALTEAVNEVERLRELYQTRSVQRQAAARAPRRSGGLAPATAGRAGLCWKTKTAAVKLLKGENSLLDAITNRRRRVSELKAELTAVENAPYPFRPCQGAGKGASGGAIGTRRAEYCWPSSVR